MNTAKAEDDLKQAKLIENVSIVREGSKISVPEGMKLESAIAALQRKRDEEEQAITIDENFDLHPLEGALAFNQTLMDKYNYVNMVRIPGSFFTPGVEPTYVNIAVDKDTTIQVPWGRLVLPGIDGYLETGFAIIKNRPWFKITGQVKGKHREEIKEICIRLRNYVKTNSFYKGKAIIPNFPKKPQSLEDFMPNFLDLSSVDHTSLIFSKELQRLVEVTLFTPIEKTDICRKHNIPLKRGILLEGPFGVGKTLTAYVTAHKCVQNGWTFVYVRSSEDLAQAIEFARKYQPAVLFSEDVDQILEGDERDERINRVLNTIDGIDAKGTEIIVVLTTNNVEGLNKAMLRPERLDAVIPIRAPDAEAAIRLVRHYAVGKIDPNENLTVVGEKLDGQIPASIHEIVQRSKLGAIARASNDSDDLRISSDDLVIAADSMLSHLTLLNGTKNEQQEPMVKAAHVVAHAMLEAAGVKNGSGKKIAATA